MVHGTDDGDEPDAGSASIYDYLLHPEDNVLAGSIELCRWKKGAYPVVLTTLFVNPWSERT